MVPQGTRQTHRGCEERQAGAMLGRRAEGYGTADYSGSKLWKETPAEDSLGGEMGRGLAILGGGGTWIPALIRGEEGMYNATLELDKCMSHLEEMVMASSAPASSSQKGSLPGRGGVVAGHMPVDGAANVAVHGAACQAERAMRDSAEAALELLKSEAGR